VLQPLLVASVRSINDIIVQEVNLQCFPPSTNEWNNSLFSNAFIEKLYTSIKHE
jgi:hypothetical protein